MLEAEDGTVLAAHGEAIGVATNNVAEYSALIAGLEKAVELGVDELEVVSDSELIVKQMRGEYKVKNEALRDALAQGGAARARVGDVRYTAVRREHNELADRLVNEALDAAAVRLVPGYVSGGPTMWCSSTSRPSGPDGRAFAIPSRSSSVSHSSRSNSWIVSS